MVGISLVEVCKRVGTGGGGETGYGTEKRCSRNLQSGHFAWWSADNNIVVCFPQ